MSAVGDHSAETIGSKVGIIHEVISSVINDVGIIISDIHITIMCFESGLAPHTVLIVVGSEDGLILVNVVLDTNVAIIEVIHIGDETCPSKGNHGHDIVTNANSV